MVDKRRPESYDARTILLHWLTALLVAAQWLGAHTIDWFPRGALRVDARSAHILIGTLLTAVIVGRLAWRWTKGRKLPHADTGVLRIAATAVHALLYVLLVSTVCLGLLNAWMRGDSLFGLFNLPHLNVAKSVGRQVNDLHGLSAKGILIVAGFHAAAALWHQYIRRDDLLVRMIPALARPHDATRNP